MGHLKCPSCGFTMPAIDKPPGELCLRCRVRRGTFVRLEPEAEQGPRPMAGSRAPGD